MSKRESVLLGVFVVIQLLIIGPTEASALTWAVENSGGTTVCSGNGVATAPLPVLPAMCGTGTDLEFQASSGTATIQAIDDGTNDILQLISTKIVAKKDLQNYVLTFEHTFNPGPTAQDYSPIFYRTHMYGATNGTAPNNRILVTSTVENAETPPLTATVTPAPPPLAFNAWDSPSTDTAMIGPRKITVKVTFSLMKDKYINFTGSSRFVRVSAQINPDDPPDSLKPIQTGSLHTILSDLQGILVSGSKACVGLSLADGSCVGIQIAK